MIHQINTKETMALLFDFDGTLVDTEAHQYLAYNRLFTEIGTEYVDRETHTRQYGGRSFREIFTAVTGELSAEVIARHQLQRRRHFVESITLHGVKSIPGAVDLIQDAHAKKLKIAIVTGASRETMLEAISRSDIPDLFHARVNAEDYQNAKPHPEPYLTAARQLGIDPRQCIVFEDALSGVRSAAAAGMDYFALATTLAAADFKGFDPSAKVIQDFREIAII